MSRIEELIQELCPEGVEFKDVDTLIKNKYITTLTPPLKLTKELYNDVGAFPIIDQGQDFIVAYTDNEKAVIEKGLFIIFGDHTETFKFVDFPFAQGADGIKIIKTNQQFLIARYFYYAIIQSYIKTGKYTRHFSFLRKTSIPIPPLPIQQEIVSILDKFTQLGAELEAELEERKRQYEYYRDQLLQVNDEGVMISGVKAEWKTLGEICHKIENIKWSDRLDEDYQYIDLSSVNRDDNSIVETQSINSTNAPSRAQQIVNTQDVIFGTTRPTLKRYSIITSKYHNQICSTGFSVLRANPEKLLPKYLFYTLMTNMFYNYVENNQKGASYPSISNSVVNKFRIPIPPVTEQYRIVEILDKFDTLVNDTKAGLPAEIAARQKQYEYYRAKLLDFKNISNG